MSEEFQLTAPLPEKTKRKASLKTRMAKMRLTRDMWESKHETKEANHEFFLTRFFDDVLNVFSDVNEAIEAVKEAFDFNKTKAQREKRQQLELLLTDPEVAAIAKEIVGDSASNKGGKK